MKVLVIDDDIILLEYMKLYFKRHNINIDIESEPELALTLIKSYQYDLVITDYGMPSMNGIQLLIKIKEFNSEQLVIMHTGSSNDKIKEKALKIGVHGFYEKPALEYLKNEINKLGQIVNNVCKL